jgi:Ni/Fe-hydrogenase 1 B-type cytochrome subunit
MNMPDPHSLRAPRSLPLRLWHWLDATVVLGSLGTVLLRKTFLSWRENGPLIDAKVAELGGSLPPDAAVAVAKMLRDRMWEWHYTFGVALAVLLVLRVGLALFDAEQDPVRSTWRLFSRVRAAPAGERGAGMHHLLVKLLYLTFYLLLAVMAASGLTMWFGDELGLSKPLADWLKEAHELLMWAFVGFVPLHVVGVVIAELRGDRGLVSGMIHGDR